MPVQLYSDHAQTDDDGIKMAKRRRRRFRIDGAASSLLEYDWQIQIVKRVRPNQAFSAQSDWEILVYSVSLAVAGARGGHAPARARQRVVPGGGRRGGRTTKRREDEGEEEEEAEDRGE